MTNKVFNIIKPTSFDEDIIILPSLYETEKFYRELNEILSNLDPQFKYKLDFYLYLHTNDKNKEFKRINLGLGDVYEKDYEEFYRYLLSMLFIENIFEFKGYGLLYKDLFYKDEVQTNIAGFIRKIYSNLETKIIETNNFHHIDEFIEYKRPTVLVTTKERVVA